MLLLLPDSLVYMLIEPEIIDESQYRLRKHIQFGRIALQAMEFEHF